MRWFDDITDSMNMSFSKPWELVMGGTLAFAIHRIAESDMTEQLN